MKKLINIEEGIAKIKDGMVVMIGGFINGGVPERIIEALSQTDVKNLTVISNDTGFPGVGLGKLIAKKQISRMICSHIGTNSDTIAQFNNKEIIVDFVPQGTLAERIRSAGAGLGGFLTPTGIGTIVENGKQIINLEGKDYILETPLKADVALIKASKADKSGNLYYIGTAQNFNPVMAFAGDIVIAEVDEIVETGFFEPQDVHTSGIFVDYVIN
ncbi:MAG: CoA transferase subunit A [Saprospiraceae bacterium]|nr:CoA transferase subunit A [Saprospiraceae bacterium]